MIAGGNLFADVPASHTAEETTALARAEGVTIERIVSHGHAIVPIPTFRSEMSGRNNSKLNTCDRADGCRPDSDRRPGAAARVEGRRLPPDRPAYAAPGRVDRSGPADSVACRSLSGTIRCGGKLTALAAMVNFY